MPTRVELAPFCKEPALPRTRKPTDYEDGGNAKQPCQSVFHDNFLVLVGEHSCGNARIALPIGHAEQGSRGMSSARRFNQPESSKRGVGARQPRTRAPGRRAWFIIEPSRLEPMKQKLAVLLERHSGAWTVPPRRLRSGISSYCRAAKVRALGIGSCHAVLPNPRKASAVCPAAPNSTPRALDQCLRILSLVGGSGGRVPPCGHPLDLSQSGPCVSGFVPWVGRPWSRFRSPLIEDVTISVIRLSDGFHRTSAWSLPMCSAVT